MLRRVHIFVCVLVCVSMPTYLMRDSKRSVKPVVLDDGAASLRRADGADVRHAQGVAGVVATEVLDKGNKFKLALHHLFITTVFFSKSVEQSALFPDNRE